MSEFVMSDVTGYPIPANTPELSGFNTRSDITFQIDGGYPYRREITNTAEFRKPYTRALFSTDSETDYPVPSDEEPQKIGAFCHCSNLREVSIPSTVTSIGRYSFTYTSLTQVELPDGCTYYSTSFPKNCKIKGGKLNG